MGSSSGGASSRRSSTLLSIRFRSALRSARMSDGSGDQFSKPTAGLSWALSTLAVCHPIWIHPQLPSHATRRPRTYPPFFFVDLPLSCDLHTATFEPMGRSSTRVWTVFRNKALRTWESTLSATAFCASARKTSDLSLCWLSSTSTARPCSSAKSSPGTCGVCRAVKHFPENGVVPFRFAELVVSLRWHVFDFNASSH